MSPTLSSWANKIALPFLRDPYLPLCPNLTYLRARSLLRMDFFVPKLARCQSSCLGLYYLRGAEICRPLSVDRERL